MSANDFDKKYNILDVPPPPEVYLSGHYKQSFAYTTLRDRLPVILTQVLDNLSRDKDLIVEIYGEESREELKEILGNISKLKYELQTDKELSDIETAEPDRLLWKIFLSSLQPESKTYFSTCWLYGECYMYRRLRSFFEKSTRLNQFDYFAKQKENALICCVDALQAVLKSIDVIEHLKSSNVKEYFRRLLKVDLWGNRCDLSISEGVEVVQTGDPFTSLDALDKNILVDESSKIWDFLSERDPTQTKDEIIDIVMDNAGYELFTDFLLATFFIEHKLANTVRFHAKAYPWFISDVTHRDFHWTLEYLREHPSTILKAAGEKWTRYLDEGKFELCPINYFWTSPYEFYRMPEVQKDLYDKLAAAHLVILKGDLNYRKLISDFSWKSTEKFTTCIRDFRPTNICTLRSVKADLICGLPEGVSEQLTAKDPKWMITGDYGVIQFAPRV